MPAPPPSPRVPSPRVAVLIPCLNEAAAIGAVVRGFRAALPHAQVLVYDNGSSDGTAAVAQAAGAEVRAEALRGKGHVIRRMFADVEADAYLLVDGDGTYDPAAAPDMVAMLLRGRLDMVTGVRVSSAQEAYRPGHRLGNRVLTGLVGAVFGNRVSDMLSGYRAFSRRFVKSFPALAEGFETETEFTVHALELRMALGEVSTPYSERAEGSTSKLNTWRDGWRILRTITRLVREERPLPFFCACAASCCCARRWPARAWWRTTCAPGWCRACPPPCSPPGWWCSPPCRCSAAWCSPPSPAPARR